MNISYENLKLYINDISKGELPIFDKEVVSIPNGYYLRYNKNVLTKHRIKSKKKIEINPVHCLEYVLKKNINKKNIALSFSGGLDSTALVYACKNALPDCKIVAFNWWNDGCSNNDLSISQDICKKLNIKLITIKIEPDDLFTDINVENHVIPNYPASYLAFIGFVERYVNILKEYFNGEDFTIINGAGGDHIFLEAIPFDSVLSFKFEKIIEFTKLTSLNYPLVFKYILHSKLKKYKFNEKRYRENCIYEGLCQSSTTYLKEFDNKFFYPFLTEEMINVSFNYDLKDTFNDKFCRIHFRNLLKDHYNSDDFFRVGKGSMTGAYQKKLSLIKNEISELIHNSTSFQLSSIDANEILYDLSNSSLGIFGVSPKLIISIIFENILKKSEEEVLKNELCF